MAVKKRGLKNIANVISLLTIILLSGVYIFEISIANITINYFLFGTIFTITLIAVIIIQRNPIEYKSEFSIPFILFLFYTLIMILSGWHNSNYLLICLFFCAISCIFTNYYRTLAFIIIQNIAIGILIISNTPIFGAGAPLYNILISWAVYICANITMLLLTKSATVILDKAVESQNSFMNLLNSTENYIAMINEQNEVVYASKTLANMGNTEDQTLTQGRPILDLFPGRTLKTYAGKMLREKSNYAEDWEFSLSGQKRYFKAASHGLPGGSGGALVNLYDMTHLAERDEIAVMKDNMKIGLFFMDRNYIIQDHYSQYLGEMLSDPKLFGKAFTDIIMDSVSASEMESIKDYLGMVFERAYDQEMLEEINPLNELHYICKKAGSRKVFQFAFAPVERGRGETYMLVTVYDITTRVELQKRLAEEEARRQEEMQAVFELIKVEPEVFAEFLNDLEFEFDNIDKILKNETLTAHEALVKIYQSVHAIKSNAVILGLNTFGHKMHNLESKIKKLREMEGEVPFADMLTMAMELEKVFNEKEAFKDIIDKLHTYTGSGNSRGKSEKHNVKALLESLEKTTSKAAEDTGKQIKFTANEIDSEAVEKSPKRTIKEILMQLIRNSAVHGIETPEVRKAKGKKETGIIKLSIKISEDYKHIHIKLIDDGAGLDYRKIAKRALEHKLIKDEDANNADVLTKIIFAPGFSTAETEGMHAGRGIGLNLVRDRLKEIKGTIKVRSETDKGIAFLISVPFENDKSPAQ